MEEAPPEWRYHLFPLERVGEEILSLEEVVRIAKMRLDQTLATGDRTPIGPVLHWAHLLQAEQGPDGDWPAIVNARTGEPTDAARTRAPAALLARLADLMDSMEFDAAIARAER